ncbi:MAG: glycosyltransferase [Chloroflexota bacterium]
MLQLVSVGQKSLVDYAPIVGEAEIQAIRALAAKLRGARVLHVNATAFGGGVAEILTNLVPLMKDVGLEAEWRVIYGSDEFFGATKTMHNALQGAPSPLTPEMREAYERFSILNAEAFSGDYDFVVIHDPQPAAIPHYHGRSGGKHWLWRCHIDTSHPNASALEYLNPYLAPYDVGIFTMPAYVAPSMRFPRLAFIAPSIDPLTAKNQPMNRAESEAIITRLGIDPKRPLLVQVSRFDPWKDPLGVIDAYRMIKTELPGVQLALAGSMASDDPEGWDYYERTVRHAGEDFDIHVLHNLRNVGNVEVNALQTAADVVIQKSTREGFGLVVTEALWKGVPVVGGRVGGIPLQVVEGETGYLVDGPLACAERTYSLLRQADVRAAMGQRGRERVRQRFLITRHLKDYLQLFATL